jgi:hypothetical protein
MRTLRFEPFPFQAVRDLLGILRALWLATDPAHVRRRDEIAALAVELRKACDQARSAPVGSLGYSAGWNRAEEATRKVGELVDRIAPLEPVVRAAAARVVGRAAGIRKKPTVR